MKIIILVFACLMLVGAQETFEVKELKPSEVQELQKLDKQLETAAAKLAEAQRVFNEAESEKNNAVHRIKASFGATLFGCMGWQERTIDTKRVEVRGKYVLITSTQEKCGSNIRLTPAYAKDGTTTFIAPDATTTMRGPVEVK